MISTRLLTVSFALSALVLLGCSQSDTETAKVEGQDKMAISGYHSDMAASGHGMGATSKASVLDPVCGMWINSATMPTVVRDGQTFGACSAVHESQLKADGEKIWANHRAKAADANGYSVQMHLMSMTAYHEMLSGMGHQGGMSNMAADDSHRLTVRIVDSTGVPVNDAVVTIEADKEGSNDGQMLKARNTGGIYGASLKLGAPGSYALEVMFAGADGQQRAAQMDYQQR